MRQHSQEIFNETTFAHLHRQSKISQPKILVKLIFSINRREDLREAEENVKLLLKYRALHPTIVCGMDLSGDPACKTFADFKHLLAQVKEAGVKLALHCGEIENASEIGEMLDFGFDRLGHGTFVCEENQLKLLQNKSIAVECCLTSNVLSQTVPNFSAHHFRDYFDRGHPVVICVCVRNKFLVIRWDHFSVSKHYRRTILAFSIHLCQRNCQLRPIHSDWR